MARASTWSRRPAAARRPAGSPSRPSSLRLLPTVSQTWTTSAWNRGRISVRRVVGSVAASISGSWSASSTSTGGSPCSRRSALSWTKTRSWSSPCHMMPRTIATRRLRRSGPWVSTSHSRASARASFSCAASRSAAARWAWYGCPGQMASGSSARPRSSSAMRRKRSASSPASAMLRPASSAAIAWPASWVRSATAASPIRAVGSRCAVTRPSGRENGRGRLGWHRSSTTTRSAGGNRSSWGRVNHGWVSTISLPASPSNWPT